MRIAVSGSHCSGKSTLIEDFLAAHPEYVHEPEPYEVLVELGEAFGEEPEAGDFYRQLELSVERLGRYEAGEQVIAERSPLDFLAYLLALCDLGRGDDALIAPAVELVARGLQHVDLLVILPLTGPADEDPELRAAMNERLVDLITTDEFHPAVVEVSGTPAMRLAALKKAAANYAAASPK